MKQYFTEEFFSFFYELSQNNHKSWFDINRKRYITHIKNPFYEFTADLIEAIKVYEPEITQEVKHAVFRINRDVRFSKDKRPYKMQVSAVISANGKKDHGFPGFYFQLGLDESVFGSGAYGPDKDQLLAIRRKIASNPAEFYSKIENKKLVSLYGDLRGSKNKRLNKEFKEVVNEHPILFNKQYYFIAESKDNDWALREDLLEYAMKYYKAQREFANFIKGALKDNI